jgi:hypothetical protein
MSDVKRYDIACVGGGFKVPVIREAEDGNIILHSDYVALRARHNALVGAVAWERECEWLNDLITAQCADVAELAPEEDEINVSYFEARAEVDRLIGEGEK